VAARASASNGKVNLFVEPLAIKTLPDSGILAKKGQRRVRRLKQSSPPTSPNAASTNALGSGTAVVCANSQLYISPSA
jgi:hypothetical protein